MNEIATYRDTPPWSTVSFRLPTGIPTMITLEEQGYLHWLGSTVWSDIGHVVEIGPWLGGSTFCLAAGMDCRSSPRHRLHAYDSFEWRPFMADRARLPLRAGESFEPQFARNVAKYSHLIEAHRCLLPDEAVTNDPALADSRATGSDGIAPFLWDEGAIEILFIDGAKSWNAMRFLLQETAHSLIHGQALIVCQDYKYWGNYWVAAMMELLGDAVQPVHVLRSNTVSLYERHLC